MRKVSRVDAPRELLLDLFLEVEAWPEWMPDVGAVEVLERSPGQVRATFRQRQFGRTSEQRLELVREGEALRHRQRGGWLRLWDGRWRFLEPPDGRGTTITLDLELRLAGFAALMPEPAAHVVLDRWLDQLIAGAETRARDLAADRGDPPTPEPPPDQATCALYETPDGLELRLQGKRYRLLPLD